MNAMQVEKFALALSCDEQFALATSLAANLGYELTQEAAHPDAPNSGAFEKLAEQAIANNTTVAGVLSNGFCRSMPGGEVYYRPQHTTPAGDA